ncbi:MAG: anaerobic ribonucleoside-triphosphate reductase activating protein [bacterium]
MKIAGLLKTSLIDYPGEISTVIFTPGCNFNCPYCHNSDLIDMDTEIYTMKEFYEHMEKRQNIITGLVITGGEPTLQKGLVDFISSMKELNIKIKLDTNGSNYDVLKTIINEKLIDYVAMDIKMPKNKYKEVTNENVLTEIMKSIVLIKNSNIKYEFRTTVVPDIHTAQDIDEIGKLIAGSKLHYIQNFKPVNTLDEYLLDTRRFYEGELLMFKEIMEKYVDSVKIRT